MDLVDLPTLAEYLSLTPGRVTQLVKAGILERVSRGQYDAPASIARYLTFRLESAAASDATADVNEARKRLYDAQVIRTSLETARIQRETIPADDHLADLREVESIFNAALDGIDNGLAEDIAGLSDAAAISDRLTLATHAIRASVADSIVSYAATVETDS